MMISSEVDLPAGGQGDINVVASQSTAQGGQMQVAPQRPQPELDGNAPPVGEDIPPDECLDQVLRAYRCRPAGYQRIHWQIASDAAAVGGWRSLLRIRSDAGLDLAALELSTEITRRYLTGVLPGDRMMPMVGLVSRAVALSAEMRSRGYAGPSLAYLDGWAEARSLVGRSRVGGALADIPADDTLRGIVDYAIHLANPDQAGPCRYRALALTAQRERELRARPVRPAPAGDPDHASR
jgi:hypothetical protein